VSGKDLVRRLVEVINTRAWSQLDVLCAADLAPKLRTAFVAFEQAFPDWRQDIVELVEEPPTVVARFGCTGTQTGDWLGLPASGRSMRVDEVYLSYWIDLPVREVAEVLGIAPRSVERDLAGARRRIKELLA
jgi:hypothetical protein